MAGQWGLDAHHRVGDVTSLDVALMGRVRAGDVQNSTVEGTLLASETDLRAIFQMLSETGMASVQQDDVTGSFRLSADVAGTVKQPTLQLIVESDKAIVAGAESVSQHAQGRSDGSTFDLEELTAAQPAASSDVNAAGRVKAAGQ